MPKSLSQPIKPTSNPPLSSNFTPKISLRLHPSPLPSIPRCKFHLRMQSCHHPKPPNTQKTLDLMSIFRALPDWADEIQERGMKKKRFLYNHEKWAEHRSSLRHVRHLMTTFSSRVVVSLFPPVIFFTSVAVFIAGYNTLVALALLPEVFPLLRSSSLPYQLTAPALALLLVFRTEASYSRFVEGTKIWTKVIAGTSDFARQVISSADGLSDGDRVIKKNLLNYIMAFPIALKCHLTNGSDARQDLESLLEEDDLAIVMNSKHRPHCIIQFISQSLHLLTLGETKKNILESKISCFHEGIGVCEQLIGNPVPLAYTRLTSRFLVFWHLTLPIILWDDCHWIVVPATFISAASLFCIEEVGVLIEEPFPMLALDELCQVVCCNIQEDMATQNTVQAHLLAKKSKTSHNSSNGRAVSTGLK